MNSERNIKDTNKIKEYFEYKNKRNDYDQLKDFNTIIIILMILTLN